MQLYNMMRLDGRGGLYPVFGSAERGRIQGFLVTGSEEVSLNRAEASPLASICPVGGRSVGERVLTVAGNDSTGFRRRRNWRDVVIESSDVL